MEEHKRLVELLRPHFGFHLSRLNFVAAFVLALSRSRTVNLTQIALGLNARVGQNSNYRRIQGFFEGFELCQLGLARFVLGVLGVGRPDHSQGWLISLDRSQWEFGQTTLKVMVLGLVYQGMALPLVWLVLDKEGNSNTVERKALMRQLLLLIPADQIQCLVADREFIGRGWWRWLKLQKIRFCIRMRENARYIQGRCGKVKYLFCHLALGQYEVLAKTYTIYGHKVGLVGVRLKEEWLILATNTDPELALGYYQHRWSIETLFAAMKTRGFNFQDTHMTQDRKIEKLIALMTLALLWAVFIGEWIATLNQLKLKKHGRKAKSGFRLGLDFLRQALFFPTTRKHDLDDCFRVLSCT